MKIKKSFRILMVISAVIITLGVVFIVRGQDNPGPTPVPPPMPLPPESIPPEDRAISYTLVSEAELLKLGMQLPHSLTVQDKDIMLQIALKTAPVDDKIKQGLNFRVDEIHWLSYNRNDSHIWTSYGYNLKDQVTSITPGIVYFPAVRIGLGTPQVFQVDIAIDSALAKAVYAVRTADKHALAPSYLHYLTEEEKAKVIQIASKAAGLSNKDYTPNFYWVAVSQPPGYTFSLGYDIVEKGIPYFQAKQLELKSMTIYPAVILKSGLWNISYAVDLKTGAIMDKFRYPVK